jgi:hypothetical protein
MKIYEIIKEGDVLPFKTVSKPSTKPVHIPNPNHLKHNTNQDEIDELVYRYRNLGVGSQILYNNRLAQIIKAPDDHRFIIKFDDTGEKKIISKKDDALDLIPEEHLKEAAIPKNVHSAVSSAYNDPKSAYRMETVLDEKLSELGWRKSGSGCFSSVYEKPSKSYIIKANVYPDTAFDYFVELTHQFKNKHFPKISDRKVIEVADFEYYIYSVEKLYPIDRRNEYLFTVDCKPYIEAIKRHLIDTHSKLSPSSQAFFAQHKELKRALDIIIEHNGSNLDISLSNIMQRKNGTLVIIDPYYN